MLFDLLFAALIMKLTTSIFIAQVRKPPDVSQADDLSCDGQEELQFVGPLSSGRAVMSSLVQSERALGSTGLLHGTAGTERVSGLITLTVGSDVGHFCSHQCSFCCCGLMWGRSREKLGASAAEREQRSNCCYVIDIFMDVDILTHLMFHV